ncbi:hypothetical protein PTTG_06992 [Puccinia triticina 1-1 BBBD Race 1]|uniref:Uncharacterized protein n=1 Tax=Puccinia triticina (isolate 1-1 / race 1 (BBBD)) TaxID=630390 RepID=A0A180G8B4_PUCT1|nr:hypothetical protein PTTG_06992 [Puccinia triticina 1-1 BBBD Race 1]
MNSTRAPNHPVTYSSHFEPLAESNFDSVRANQYGFVKTPSFLQCGGTNEDKDENFEVELVTNTTLTNVLDPDFIYSIHAGTSKVANQSVFSKSAKTSLGIRSDSITTPTKGKQKAVEPSDDEEEHLFDDGIDNEVDQDDEPNNAPETPPKRGRPRKSIIQEAAKRMKKF